MNAEQRDERRTKAFAAHLAIVAGLMLGLGFIGYSAWQAKRAAEQCAAHVGEAGACGEQGGAHFS